MRRPRWPRVVLQDVLTHAKATMAEAGFVIEVRSNTNNTPIKPRIKQDVANACGDQDLLMKLNPTLVISSHQDLLFLPSTILR